MTYFKFLFGYYGVIVLICLMYGCFKKPLAETGVSSDRQTNRIKIRGDKNIVNTYIIDLKDTIATDTIKIDTIH